MWSLPGMQNGTYGMPVLQEGLLLLIVSSCDSTTVLSTGKTVAQSMSSHHRCLSPVIWDLFPDVTV